MITCKDCGEYLEGDGFTGVIHCPNIEELGYHEPDAGPVYCGWKGDGQYPPCDYCGVIPDHHPWHGSGMFNGEDSPHIHACNDCRHLLPTRPAKIELQPDVAQLVEALEEIIHPVQLAEDASYLRGIAEAALATYRKQETSKGNQEDEEDQQ